ncbi:MAG TPA: M28 family peptidase [Terriglobia bacterium]|nr:M28 family peptidase [Terriglobia bacterium]
MASEAPPKQASAVAAIGTLALIAVLSFLAVYQVQPPAPVAASAPPADFSAERGVEHLRAIAQKPHPTGSAENARVRDYLVTQLQALGLDPQVVAATVVRYEPKWRVPAVAATVNNIVARLRGTANTKAVMLAAHYDSVPTGPGASDDGSGAVTLLETARALRSGPPLPNDVIFLITDGEELGLMGAQGFVNEHPWVKDVGVALNFEARGACGPSFMFETSQHNGWLIREFAQAAPYSATSSFAYEAYKHLPNDTDLTVFKGAGLAGLNFAYIGCWARYHTWRDDLESISAASLQHDGSYALALARHFGGLDLTHTSAPDAVYFSLLGKTVHYPEALAVPLMVLAVLLFIGIAALGLRKRQLTWGGILAGFLAWLGGALLAAALAHFAWSLLRRTSLVNLLPYGMAYNGDLYAYGFLALTVAILCALHVALGRKIQMGNLTFGALAWWAILTVITSLSLKGASYLFTWPLFASLVELGYAFSRRDPEAEGESALVWTLPAIVGILLFGGLPYLLVMLISTTLLPAIVIPTALLVGLLVPHIHIMTSRRRWLLPAGALVAALALFVAAIAHSGYDAAHPRADSIAYALDADTGKAMWASRDNAPDAWTSQFLGAGAWSRDLGRFSFIFRTARVGDAPSISLAAPAAVVTDDVTFGEVRDIRVLISSPRQAGILWLGVENARVLGADVNGKKVTVPAAGVDHWSLAYVGAPASGLVVTLKVPVSQTPSLTVVDEIQGLPQIPGKLFRSRPDDLMADPVWGAFDSSVLVAKTYRLDVNAPMPGM